MLFLISLIGLAAVALTIPMLFREAEQRRRKAIRQMHTRLVARNFEMDPVDLMSTEIVIGRWTRRCDVSLAHLHKGRKSPISRIHAVLWWDGSGFRIAPVYTRWWGRWSRPKVWVGMTEAPEGSGLSVNYEDVITLSDDEWELELVDTSDEYVIAADESRPAGRGARRPNPFWKFIDGLYLRLHRKPAPSPNRAARSGGRKKGRGLWVALAAVAVVIAVLAGIVLGSMTMPQAETALGIRKKDTAAFLICGVDGDGVRTDTMMLVYLSGSEGKMSLLSLPRDTISVNKNGKTRKLNAIYAGNEAEGAEDLLDVVQKYIGYRPDGYLIFNWTLVKDITDLMGGVDVTLDTEVSVADPDTHQTITIPVGEHHLNGEQTLAAVRFRAGYFNADLGRIQVQRKVLKACKEQWIALDKLDKVDDAIDLLMRDALTDLTPGNLMWIAKTAFLCEDMSVSETLAGYDQYRSGVSYYILDPRKIVDQINENFNPYQVKITQDMLETIE